MLSASLSGPGYSYLTVFIKARYVGGVGMRAWACMWVTTLMRTIIFLHLDPISHDYDDGLSYPYYPQD